MNINKTIANVKRSKAHTAWNRGVKVYALSLLKNLKANYSGRDLVNVDTLKKALLNGADNWQQYSYSGHALTFDYDIGQILCSPSDFKRFGLKKRRDISSETWLDIQTMALYAAYLTICECGNFFKR
jgi:hypothetical protein